jgi:GntR family transcriptional regulator
LAFYSPICQQIHIQIVVAIAEESFSEGFHLPTTRQLAQDYGFNFNTVNKGYNVLQREGFAALTRRNSSIVRRDPEVKPQRIEDWQSRLRTVLAEAVAPGLSADDIPECCRAALYNFTLSKGSNDGNKC